MGAMRQSDPISTMSDQEPGDYRQECPRCAVLCEGGVAKVEGARCALGCLGWVLLRDLRQSTWVFLGTVWVWLLWVSETPCETLWVRLKH